MKTDLKKLIEDKNQLCIEIANLIEYYYRAHKYDPIMLDFIIQPKIMTFPDGSQKILMTEVKAKIFLT